MPIFEILSFVARPRPLRRFYIGGKHTVGKSQGFNSFSRALSNQIEPFDRDDFASWLGALRMTM